MAPRDDDEFVDVEFEKVVSPSDTGGTGDSTNAGIPDDLFKNVVEEMGGNGGAAGTGEFKVEDMGTQTFSNFDFSQLEGFDGRDRERPSIPKEILEAMEREAMERDAMEVDSEEVSEPVASKDKTTTAEQQERYLEPPKTLMDWSLDSGDPRWKETRIPWCRGMEYIDGKLAFLTEIDGETYGIGMPFDHAVAIIQLTPKEEGKTLEDDKGASVRYINPDKYEEEEDSQELMEIMAKEVQEKLGEDLILRKTPKVLTISGDLGKYTDNWEMNLMDEPTPVKDLMDGMDDFVNSVFREEKKTGDTVDEFDIAEDKEMAEFLSFMRSELGDEEFEKTMNEEMSEEDKELAKLFNFELDETDFAENLEEETKNLKEEALSFHPDSDGVALKLIGFEFGDRSKSFQLVKLLQPFPLVGKKIQESVESGFRFELLTPQEEEVLIPKLQAACQEDLKKAGLSLEKDDIQATTTTKSP
ncbi:unnamed protein product [Cylindrotheca closterium]|uniref:Uncharacterized protein n=1 Tax=Cylindrotheca closterium TaxID=2856 RepID=A0AAD2JMM4_9STRA|nr:unnamed protein product [Cylindrotheca closterium]